MGRFTDGGFLSHGGTPKSSTFMELTNPVWGTPMTSWNLPQWAWPPTSRHLKASQHASGTRHWGERHPGNSFAPELSSGRKRKKNGPDKSGERDAKSNAKHHVVYRLFSFFSLNQVFLMDFSTIGIPPFWQKNRSLMIPLKKLDYWPSPNSSAIGTQVTWPIGTYTLDCEWYIIINSCDISLVVIPQLGGSCWFYPSKINRLMIRVETNWGGKKKKNV